MWNLVTNRPIETRRNPIIWTTTTHPAEDSPPMEIVYNKELIVTPVVSVLSSSNAAPKPPKKRFLEAAAAAQQKQEEVKAGQEKKAGADNSALMQLAEMCVYYQKSGQPARYIKDICKLMIGRQRINNPVFLSFKKCIKINNSCFSLIAGNAIRPFTHSVRPTLRSGAGQTVHLLTITR